MKLELNTVVRNYFSDESNSAASKSEVQIIKEIKAEMGWNTLFSKIRALIASILGYTTPEKAIKKAISEYKIKEAKKESCPKVIAMLYRMGKLEENSLKAIQSQFPQFSSAEITLINDDPVSFYKLLAN